MKEITVSELEVSSGQPPLEEISVKLDRQPKHRIDILNWKDYQYKPDVSFSMAYSSREIFLKYYVKESLIMAEKTETNQMVCEDSCVEFFVSPANDGIYYNLEFNPIGTCLLGTGTSRETSKRADPAVVAGIRRLASSGTEPFSEREGEFDWTLTLAIPFEVFFHHNIDGLKGKTFRANFYKCGDNLTVPHYVTWSPVGTANPDYHQPAFFGTIRFV